MKKILITILISANAQAITIDGFLALTKDRSIEAFQANKEFQSIREERAVARALYYPELGVKTGAETNGVGRAEHVVSEGFAFAYAKMNIFNGGYDKDSVRIKTLEMDKKEDHSKYLTEVAAKKAKAYFYKLLYHAKKKKLLFEEKQTNSELMQLAANKKKAGITSESDYIEFENKELEIESELYINEDEKYEVEKNAKAYFVIKDSDMPTDYEGDFSIKPVQVSGENILQSTKDTNLKIQEISYDIMIADKTLERTRTGILPKIDAEANIGMLNGRDRKFENQYEWQGLVSLTWPLFTGMSSVHERRSAVYKKEAKEAELVKEKQFIKADIESTQSRIKNIQKRYAIEQKNNGQAQKYYELTVQEYKRGVKNSPDMLGAIDKLYQSKMKILELERDHNLARVHLSEISGVEL